MVTIRDPIHGDIEISQTERRLLDTGEMQRLRRVKQLAMAYLVYPGANHTRFEHSIGTMELAGKICASCEIENEKTEQLRIAALLHDVGHVCFSHEGEFATKMALGTHEEIGRKKMLEGEIADILNENWGARKISELSASQDFGGIISSD
ncbi:phosphodiesterase, partial [Candidatus Micrarchaeota archaeon CG11_big_fil_rev_8_21_14_0_20_47_5]